MDRDTIQFVVFLVGLGVQGGIFYGAVAALKEKTRRLETGHKSLGERLGEMEKTQTRHDERLDQLREQARGGSFREIKPARRMTRSDTRIPDRIDDDGGSRDGDE